MAFIIKDDIIGSIDENILDDITEFDDNKLDTAIDYAVKLATGHLSARYDTDLIFAATGVDRDTVILNVCIDLCIFKLHQLISPRKIPKFRVDAYHDAKDWLGDVKEGKINQPGLPTPIDGTKQYILYGGNTRRDNQY